MQENPINAGIPRPDRTQKTAQSKGAAARCRNFMEDEGWDQLFAVARGTPVIAHAKTPFGTKRCTVSPDLNERLKAYGFILSYGYGRPAELADPDTGRSVTDLLLTALRPHGSDAQGTR